MDFLLNDKVSNAMNGPVSHSYYTDLFTRQETKDFHRQAANQSAV